jgi:3-hydroxyisobutyrate dehydrogenase-like beta-hydroxyacid dehydrogenase
MVAETNPSVGVVGLGLMGRPIARRLGEYNIATTGWNRSTLSTELLDNIAVRSLDDVARQDIVLLMLADSPATDEVLAQIDPSLRAGQVVLDMGSSEPGRSRVHARRLDEREVGWVDAPVSGGPEGAEAGSLAIMVGGSITHVATTRAILEILGGSVVHVGDAGAGHTTKIVNQLITGLAIEAVAEGLTLAEKAGLDPALVQQALTGGFADSRVLQLHGSRMIARDYTPGGLAKTHLKDLRMAQALAQDLQISLPHAEDVAARYEHLVERGEGELDHSALHKLLWD